MTTAHAQSIFYDWHHFQHQANFSTTNQKALGVVTDQTLLCSLIVSPILWNVSSELQKGADFLQTISVMLLRGMPLVWNLYVNLNDTDSRTTHLLQLCLKHEFQRQLPKVFPQRSVYRYLELIIFIPPVYEVYRGYIVFAFSVCVW